MASDNKEHEPSFCPKKLWGNHWVSFVLNLSDLPFFLQLCSNPFARPWNCGPGFKINFSSYAFTSRSTHANLYSWKNSSCTQMNIDYNIVHPCSQMPSDINKRYSICFSNKGGGAHIGPVISAHRGKRVPHSSLSARNQVSGNGQGKTCSMEGTPPLDITLVSTTGCSLALICWPAVQNSFMPSSGRWRSH